MAKKRTKADKLRDQYDAYKCIQAGKKPKRSCNKDGSITVKPRMDVPPYPESTVLKECMSWLKERGIMADRNNVGTGSVGTSGIYSYGIKSGGDIFVVLKGGIHMEIECKSGKGGRWSIGQQKRKSKVESRNAIYIIVCGVTELEDYFRWNVVNY